MEAEYNLPCYLIRLSMERWRKLDLSRLCSFTKTLVKREAEVSRVAATEVVKTRCGLASRVELGARWAWHTRDVRLQRRKKN